MAETLTECPNVNPLVFSAIWHFPAGIPNFTICSRCFEDNVRHTPFAARFQSQRLDAQPDRACLFNTQRMRTLWSSSLINNNQGEWDAVQRYMQHRAQIPNCRRKEGVRAGSEAWYIMRNAEIADFVCCPACYEDVVCATPFAERFVLSPALSQQQLQQLQQQELTMVCDLSVKFIYRALLEQAPRNDWTTFTHWAAGRMKLPACTSLKTLKCSSTTWFMPNPPLYGVLVCGACFHDGADLTPMAASFLQASIPPDRTEQVWECANSVVSALPMAIAWGEACSRKDVSIWYNAARAISNYPPCTKDGIVENGAATWYSMPGCPNFKICGRCYAGIVQIHSRVLGQYFHQQQQQQQHPQGNSAYVCDFFINKSRRVLRYLEKLDEAVALSNGHILHDFIARVSAQPLCPTDGLVSNRNFYCSSETDGGATICESCYEEAIRGTGLASRLTLRTMPTECICDAYSPRMRGIWMAACARNDMSHFAAALKERMQVYALTVPRMRTILEIAKMRMNTQSALMMSSVMLTGADNVVSASRPVGMPHDLYGNAQIGYRWETAAGAQGEMQFQQAIGMGIKQTGDMAEMAQLVALWKQYE